jgi:hypothetical protein
MLTLVLWFYSVASYEFQTLPSNRLQSLPPQAFLPHITLLIIDSALNLLPKILVTLVSYLFLFGEATGIFYSKEKIFLAIIAVIFKDPVGAFLHRIFERLLRIPPMGTFKGCKNIHKLPV